MFWLQDSLALTGIVDAWSSPFSFESFWILDWHRGHSFCKWDLSFLFCVRVLAALFHAGK